MLDYLWLIPILPLLGFLINGCFGLWRVSRGGERPAKPFVYTVACGFVLISFLLSLGCFWELTQLDPHDRIQEIDVISWIPGPAIRMASGELANFEVSWGLQLDPLSAVMILVVTGIGFLIHVYSIGYMAEEGGLLSLFLLPEPLHVHDADPSPGQQLPGHVRGVGRCGALLLSFDRLLHGEEECRGCGQESLRSQSDRGLCFCSRNDDDFLPFRNPGLHGAF